jgi:hypothetical protein
MGGRVIGGFVRLGCGVCGVGLMEDGMRPAGEIVSGACEICV